jgi:hypothetical protein
VGCGECMGWVRVRDDAARRCGDGDVVGGMGLGLKLECSFLWSLGNGWGR